MRMVDLIEKKRDGGVLSKEEIDFIIENYTTGVLPDYQMSALAMAIFYKGMTDEEATNLALAMLRSGDEMDLSSIPGIKVDKHSTGGVGDKTSLVLAPIVAALGINFAKMSGRGLGHTGGTIDKLESIPNFNVAIPTEQFIEQVKRCHLALVGQTGNLTPADKKLYALRDVTATVDSLPLIAASIMSKKLASGANVICLDVKVGAGAFMKTMGDAEKLAELMVQIGTKTGRKMTAILTDMDEPLGRTVGNALEVKEAIETLRGNGPKDLEDLCIEISGYLIMDAGYAKTLEEGRARAYEQIRNGKALEKLVEMVREQGGNAEYILDPSRFAVAKEIIPVHAKKAGYVHYINASEIGIASMTLGGGRETMQDTIDMAVGVVLEKKIGDQVKVGDVLAYIHSNGKRTEEAVQKVFDAYEITQEERKKEIILQVIRP